VRVTKAENAAAARQLLTAYAIDLVLLDVMMPGEDGLSLAGYIRATSSIPVILVTAKAEEMDRVVGLEIGADDYVTKPFSPRELLARIKAVLRRVGENGALVRAPDTDSYGFGPWILKSGERELVGEDGVAIPLSTGEYNLLHAFVTHPGGCSTATNCSISARAASSPPSSAASTIISAAWRKIESAPPIPS
jgi:two-component system OmpR family response regulator